MRIRIVMLAALLLAAFWSVTSTGRAQTDDRLTTLKTLNDHFPFDVPNDPAAWHPRAESLRRQVLVATGLWPMPTKTPLRPMVFGKTVRDGFTVEKVIFQSLPGHFVTGLLFRPASSDMQDHETHPGVLCPHGHGGRNQTFTDDELADQLASGGEHFAASGRSPKLARCAQLARMGCVSFIFDMIGYDDSIQIPYEVAHRHAKPRPEEKRSADPSDGWVMFSADADLRLQSIMGLQTWNSIRALDFLASLSDVDDQRLAVTGGSGGGTQSIILGAIDPRVKVSFPNGMVSTSMQGGCYCENCNLLRVGTGNVELAALFAPRPQAMTAADDWTSQMMTDGFPQLEWLYAMIGDQRDVQCRPMLEFKHNYNYIARATMYQWMNRHLGLGLYEPIIEQDFVPLTEDERTIWDGTHPKPTVIGIEHERQVCKWFDDQATRAMKLVEVNDASSLEQFREIVGSAWQTIYTVPRNSADGEVQTLRLEKIESQEGVTTANLFDPSRGAVMPITIHGDENAKRVLVWTGKPTGLLDDLVGSGNCVIVPQLLGKDQRTTSQPLVDDPRDYSALTFGYNPTIAAHRCADLLSVIQFADQRSPTRLGLIAGEGTTAWAAMAAVIAKDSLDDAILVDDGFRFQDVETYRDLRFVPGSVKYGDVPAIFALREPHSLCLVGGGEVPPLVSDVYSASGAKARVKVAASLRLAVSAWLD